MKQCNNLIAFIALSVIFIFPESLSGQEKLNDYQKAEKFIHFNVENKVYNLRVNPQWIKKTSRFWFKKEKEDGHEYLMVNAEDNRIEPFFNHQKLAQALSAKLDKKVSADSLPLDQLKFEKKKERIRFQTDTNKWLWNMKVNQLKKAPESSYDKKESVSPDSSFAAFIKDHNLYVKSLKTGDTTQLTTDGEAHYDYAVEDSWYNIKDETTDRENYDPEIWVNWSPDSKKLITYKLDKRDVEKLYLYQSLPDTGMRAKVYSYQRPLPGEETKKYEYYIFDVVEKEKTRVDLSPFASFLSNVGPEWTEDGENIYLARFNRGYKSIDLFFIDPETGQRKTIVRDSSETMVEYQMINCKVIKNGEKVLWTSERDGWNHIYLYEGNGELINQITQGEYVVRDIKHVDKKTGTVWFVAGGKESERDPYYRHLYKVNFDGSGMELLTPENADHNINVGENGKYFIDTYSRVDLKPQSLLRRMDNGRIVRKIQQANVEKLEAMGYKPPKMFKVKARDGKTDIYGVLYLPSDFDPDKKYPVIDASYTGPQAVYTPKTYTDAILDDRLPLAETGFAVMTVDGMGTAMRSKAFHDMSYKNLGDIGAPDHIGAIRQLKKQYDFLDTNRVGIYGHSAGGYDAAHALLIRPDFYKVGVSSAGNHDQRMAKAWWPEQYMGMPGEHYTEQSNLKLAGNLEGKLLLVHGDMDNNVNPACTFRFAAELVKHNKDFELLIIPNKNHGGLYDNPYFIRKRWDYFVKHLMGKEPPKEYKIEKK
ncbi:MAG: DPP IV N-terminal domain-containing protein [Bacteroidales bacterium]